MKGPRFPGRMCWSLQHERLGSFHVNPAGACSSQYTESIKPLASVTSHQTSPNNFLRQHNGLHLSPHLPGLANNQGQLYSRAHTLAHAGTWRHTCRDLCSVLSSACRRMLSLEAVVHLLRSAVTCPVSMLLCASTSPTCAISRWFCACSAFICTQAMPSAICELASTQHASTILLSAWGHWCNLKLSMLVCSPFPVL